jgi:hypothetical protein
VPQAAAEALASATLYEYSRAYLTILFLPATDELLAFDPGPRRPEEPLVHRVTPVYNAPLRSDLVGMETAAFLDARISTRTVLGLPDWVYKAEPDDAATLPETCPAYRCSGYLKGDGDARALKLVDAVRPERTQPLRLTGVTGLTGWLARQARSLDGALTQWGEEAVVAVPAGPEWTFPVSGTAARRMMDGGLPVTRPLGVSVRDEEATVMIAARLEPADDAARAAFALDRAVGALLAEPLDQLAPPAMAAAIAAATLAFGHELSAADVRGELWRRRQFFRLYVLRAADDFPYA